MHLNSSQLAESQNALKASYRCTEWWCLQLLSDPLQLYASLHRLLPWLSRSHRMFLFDSFLTNEGTHLDDSLIQVAKATYTADPTHN